MLLSACSKARASPATLIVVTSAPVFRSKTWIAEGPFPAVPKVAGPDTYIRLPFTTIPSGKPGVDGTLASVVILPIGPSARAAPVNPAAVRDATNPKMIVAERIDLIVMLRKTKVPPLKVFPCAKSKQQTLIQINHGEHGGHGEQQYISTSPCPRG